MTVDREPAAGSAPPSLGDVARTWTGRFRRSERGVHRHLCAVADPGPIFHADYTVLGSADCCAPAHRTGVDRIFATSDPAAIARSWIAQRLGVDVSSELVVVGLDARTREAWRMLARSGRGASPERVVIEPELVVRGSTRRLAESAR